MKNNHPPATPVLRLDLEHLRTLNGANFVGEARGVFHPDRTLAVHDLLFHMTGRRSIVVGGTRFDLTAGDTLLLPAGLRHHAPDGNPTAVRSAYLHFSTHPADRVASPGGAEGKAPSPPVLEVPLHRSGASDPRIPTLFEEIIGLDHSADPRRRFRARVLLADLLVLLSTQETSGAGGTAMDLLLDRIDRNPGSGETLDDFAVRYGMNRRTLCRQFHQTTGKSIHQYRLEARIRSATHTLRVAPHTPIQELSDQLGFADPFHFSRAFKAQMGVSPKGFLKTRP